MPKKSSPKLPSVSKRPTTKNPTSSMLSGSSSPSIQVTLPLSPSNDLYSHSTDATSAMQKPANAHYMASSLIQSVQIMQPQYRNRHNFMIFGGFLLKSTFELAFTCTSALSHARPRFLALDPSTFANPVPVGSVLYMTAVAAYTEPGVGDSTRVQIRVDTHVRSVEHGEVRPTGQFNYTFEVPGELSVLPQTYDEFVIYLDARRRAMRVAGRAGSSVDSAGQDGILG